MSTQKTTTLDAAAATCKVLTATEAVLRAADLLRERRDELLAVIAAPASDPAKRPQRQAVAR